MLTWFFTLLIGLAAAQSAEGTLPVLVYEAAPVYPTQALEEGVESTVLLEILVSIDGQVVDARVAESGGPGFDEAALQAVRSFRFDPALNAEGVPTEAVIGYRLNFASKAAVPLSLEGVVRDPATEAPLFGAAIVVRAESGDQQRAVTDDEGRFAFAGLADGAWTLESTAAGGLPVLTQLELRTGAISTVVLYADYPERASDSDASIIVEAERPAIEVTERVFSADDIQYLPGTSGDVVKVVQNLPGVTRPPLGVGQLIIRGVAPEDSAYFFDGGQIPLVFHFSGLTTILPSDAISEVAYLPGSYGVRYGRVLGGLVDLRTSAALPEEKSRSYVSADVYQATFFSERRINDDSAVSLSGRRSYVDAVLNPILNNGGATVQAPRYYDFQARYWSQNNDGERWDAYLLASDDRFLVIGSEEEGGAVEIGLVTTFQKLKLQRVWNLGQGIYSETNLLGGPEEQLFLFEGDGEAYERPFMVGLRQEFRRSVDDGPYGFRFGLDSQAGTYEYLYDVPFYGDREGGQTGMFRPGAYAEFTWQLGALRTTLGSRVDAMAFNEGIVGPVTDPRFSFRLALDDFTDLKGGVGRHHQFPLVRELLSEGDGGGDPNLLPERALQSSIGLERRLSDAMTVDVTGFYHGLDQLVSGREDAFRFFTGPPPLGPFDTDPYANDGVGRVYGLETLLRMERDDDIGLIAFTYCRSFRTDRPDEEEQLFEYDSPLTVNALYSREVNRGWRLGSRIRASSGYAYSPVINRWYDHDSRSFIPVYGETDSERLPSFFSLDIRVDKEWEYKNWTLTTYLDLQNATNATNPEWMSWTYDYGEESPVEAVPALPAFGVKGEW